MLRLLSVAFISTLFSCTLWQIQGDLDNGVLLAPPTASCTTVATDGDWRFLLGTGSISAPDFSTYERKPGLAYRYVESSTWVDVSVNIVVGYLTSITRNTVSLEECESELVISTPRERALEIENALAQVTALSGQNSTDGNLPLFVMRDGQVVRGRLVEWTESEIVIEETIEITAAEEGETELFDRVVMKNGEEHFGHIIGQTRDHITLRSEASTLSLSKANVARIEYQVRDTRIRTSTRTVTLPQNQVSRVIVDPRRARQSQSE